MRTARRRIRRAVSLVCLLSIAGASAAAWGPEGHRRIGEKAIDFLRDPLEDFFEDREEEFYDLLDDPARGRNPARFFLDGYDDFPFYDVPATRALALRRFSEEEIAEHGDALWRLLEAYDALVAAFSAGDFDLALELASDVAWLVGELAVPPNTSSGGDGQATGQDGLARRFDTRLIETFADELRIPGGAAVYLDRPREFIRSLPLKAYIWVDNISFVDAMSRRGVAGYDRFYLDGMWGDLGGLVGVSMSDAARDAASLWYTAWVAAGRPEVPGS